MNLSKEKINITPKLSEIKEVVSVGITKVGLVVKVSRLTDYIKEDIYKVFEKYAEDVPFKIVSVKEILNY